MDETPQQMTQIRWHGRGGQGAITAAKIVAEAAFQTGYGGVVMAPTFGTERRGAPVSTSLKVSRDKITDLSPIQFPDIVVVLDYLIMHELDVTVGLKPGGLLVINAPQAVQDWQFAEYQVAVANVTKLATEAGLSKGIVNSGIIGALARASELVAIDLLESCIAKEFSGRKPEENVRAARLAYESTEVFAPHPGVAHA